MSEGESNHGDAPPPVPAPHAAESSIVPPTPGSAAPETGPATDRWAHRRTEPRPLAFLWTTFLAVASGLTMVTLVAQGAAGHDVYRPAARALFAVVGAGVCVLWPMLRLSQANARESASAAVAKDIAVLIAPAQAVLWPQSLVFLADWPFPVIGACAAQLCAWTLLTGAVLAIALAHVTSAEASPQRARALRTRWMIAFVLLAGVGPLISVVAPTNTATSGTAGDVNAPMLASPITAVIEITADRPWSGRAAVALPAHWRAGLITLALAVLVWVAGIPLRRRFHLACGAGAATGPSPPIGIQTEAPETTRTRESASGPAAAAAAGVTPSRGSSPDGNGHQGRS